MELVVNWLEKSHRPLLYTALIASIVTSTGLLSIQYLWRKQRIQGIKADMEVDWDELPKAMDQKEFIGEQLSRNIAFLGEQGVEKVRKSFVIVVGLGGVGSHAAHMLVRAGVEKVRFIDFDQVTLSSLNRHAVATRADVGIPKVIAMKNHLLKTVPHCDIDARVQLFQLKDAAELLDGKPDYVLDCIDHLQTKAELINYCVKNNIRVVASMGAGAKCDPSRIQIADISETFEDPLARATRQELKRNGCASPVPVVYSTEKPSSVKLLPLDESKVEEADQYSALPSFRSRILPVLGTIPALFGNAMASFVLTELAGFPTEPLPVKVTKRQSDKFFQELLTREAKIQGQDMVIKVNADDLAFIFQETWRSRSAISQSVNEKMVMIRWDPTKPVDFGNMICLTKKEAYHHENLKPEQFKSEYSKEVLDYIQSRFEKEAQIQKWR